MRILNREQFLALPAGYVYAKYVPCMFESMSIKGDTIYHDGKAIDWFYQQIMDAIDAKDSGEWGNLLEESELTGKSVPMNFECEGRDGCFEDDQLFAVFEPKDVADLIQRLMRCIPPFAALGESKETK